MAAIGNTNLTLLDLMKRTDPSGAPAQLVELISQQNAILKDAVWREGNLPTGERVSSRTGLPAIGYRKFNEGVLASKSRTDNWDESVAMMEGMSVVDCELAKLNGNEAAYRSTEESGFVQSLSNEVESGFFYASTKATPEKFLGLSPRFDSTTAPGGKQIILHDTGAAGADSTSIWLVRWGEDSVYAIYPKGSTGGLTPHDMGVQLWDDGTGKKFRAYVTNWSWKIGLVVRDWRQVVRIANIDATTLVGTGSALITSMIKAVHKIQNRNGGRLAWYCNRSMGTYLHLQALDSTRNSTLSIRDIAGEMVTTLLGIPIRETDAIIDTESPVV